MDLPEVTDHEVALTFAQVRAICEKRVAEHNKPCVTVQEGDRICFAFLDLDGTSSTVHCFIEKREEDK